MSNASLKGSSSSGTVSIPELSSDPVSPTTQSAWVLKTTSGSGAAWGTKGKIRTFMGGGFPVPGTNGGAIITTYQFSYRTLEGTTMRANLS